MFWNYHYQSLDAWNAHTPDYTDRGNVTLFLELAAKNDLFVIWRIGPYICAVSISIALVYFLFVSKILQSTQEWPGGGYPAWLKQIPGTKTRTATQPYMNLTYTWMHEHIEYVRPFFAENGGPIIMTQMEAQDE